MKRDHGWIHTLLEEAENERMHLLTFMQLREPGLMFRLMVLLGQVRLVLLRLALGQVCLEVDAGAGAACAFRCALGAGAAVLSRGLSVHDNKPLVLPGVRMLCAAANQGLECPFCMPNGTNCDPIALSRCRACTSMSAN
jgi:Alternative oxidase